MRHFIAGVAISLLASGAAFADENCYKTCPVGAAQKNSVVTRPSYYTLSNNPTTKFADWVAYRVTKSTIGKTQTRTWKQAPELSASDTLHPDDYTGAPGALTIDRGHQAPLASFTANPSKGAWKVMNFLSNITPQGTELNQGPWERLESAERTLAKAAGIAAVYVVTGPLYEKDMKSLPNATRQHVVPSGYWKVVAVDENGILKSAAFIMHQDAKRNDDYCNNLVTISDVEERSGLELFPNLSRAKRKALAESAGELVDGVGCEFIETAASKRVKTKIRKP
ncbi:DNA/RNA non-specific endonuclease [Ferrovibrio sp.]|uniref:DNA/RNA non-specific endonuclease n=1 Tax=Ferrovibrio sp. TaxID=1917215 RepID=UPI000CABF2A4|nr:DNA/RNA non-specific endonuclease [Ferrovibrio sp.]PJI42191.1 MAG: endonuclease [Ferrovibrio sp.]